jgi:hypothetical protein
MHRAWELALNNVQVLAADLVDLLVSVDRGEHGSL